MIDEDYINEHGGKHGYIDCNGDFLWIRGPKQCGYGFISSKDNNTYLSTTCTKKELGNAINNALSKTISYEYSKEIDDILMEEARIDKEEQFQYLKKIYGYKKEVDLYRNMMLCWIDLNNGVLRISPMKQVRGGWDGLGKKSHILLKSETPAELIGATARFAFTRCQGKGRDIVVKALFPDSEPDSLEEYLASVSPDYQNWLISC
jgi:hypothetical protein